jgi:hypothetical protein
LLFQMEDNADRASEFSCNAIGCAGYFWTRTLTHLSALGCLKPGTETQRGGPIRSGNGSALIGQGHFPPIEEANAYQNLIDNGYDAATIAAEVSVSVGVVNARLALLKLDSQGQTLVRAGQLSATMASEIANAPARFHTGLIRKVASGEFKNLESSPRRLLRHQGSRRPGRHLRCRRRTAEGHRRGAAHPTIDGKPHRASRRRDR